MQKELFNIENKVAFITGGGRGLGRQIAEAYASSGCHIAVCSRHLDQCEETAQYLEEKYGVKAKGYSCNIQSENEVNELVNQILSDFGQIDILVNNSGATWGAPVEEMPLEAWEKVMNVNLTGMFLVTKAVGKQMIERRSGKIINIGSVAGIKAEPPEVLNAIGYSTSKAAVHHFTKDLARKWARHQIYVNAIAPGFFPSKMTKHVLAERGEEIKKHNPLGRIGDDHALMGAALYFASPASDFVTGQVLAVDGGSTL
ncbi:SDR family oxidoreductase [Neobacillus rhizophilus]|uniref:SDR family oxidoreductase n=1 Tax=Neobacillus rhizophilus TaxID=2833579 RepID=A0A942U262_9BACI|nr:SDR family oxidoreductase [Neobacillus rhizophilus]MBS4210887.1 SDR family oxidoreductase [Neobacillus rhizophilus]